MGELLRRLWNDSAFFLGFLGSVPLIAALYLAAPEGRPWYERLFVALAGLGTGVGVAAAARRGPNGTQSPWIVGLLSLALAVALGCGTTPTDRYYSALTTLAGTREAAIAYCKVPTTPVEHCTAMREAFFVPGDAAVEAMENARLAVISECAGDSTSPACKDAGQALSKAAAGVAAVSADLTRWLAAQGVKP